MQNIELVLEPDTTRSEGGYALIYLLGAASLQGDQAFTVKRRHKTQPFLTERGWQPKVSPDGGLRRPLRVDQDDLVLTLDPKLTRYISDFEPLEFEFEGLGVKGVVSWQGVPQFIGDYSALQREVGRGTFSLNADGSVSVEAIIESASGRVRTQRTFVAGAPVYGVAYGDIQSARTGEIEFDVTAGTGSIVSRQGRQLGHVRFELTGDNNISLSGTVETRDGSIDVADTIGPGENFQLATYDELARNRSGTLTYDLLTGEVVEIRADVAEASSAPLSPDITTVKPKGPGWLLPALFLLIVLIAGGGLAAAYVFGMLPFGGAHESEPPEPESAQDLHDAALAQIEAGACDDATRLMERAFRGGHPPAAIEMARAHSAEFFDGCLAQSRDERTALRYLKAACDAGEKDAAGPIIAALESDLTVSRDAGDVRARQLLDEVIPAVRDACN